MPSAVSSSKFRPTLLQTNTRAAARLYETVAEYAGLSGGETVLDLYTGTGTIPSFSPGTADIVGIEISASAVADAQKNCRLNGITNCRFVRETSGLPARPRCATGGGGHRSALVGMARDAVGQVMGMAPERIVYVSCNPATLARDLALLKDAYDVLGNSAV
jgi:23S rRNA (uracil1939-C5)-methyltransferase